RVLRLLREFAGVLGPAEPQPRSRARLIPSGPLRRPRALTHLMMGMPPFGALRVPPVSLRRLEALGRIRRGRVRRATAVRRRFWSPRAPDTRRRVQTIHARQDDPG